MSTQNGFDLSSAPSVESQEDAGIWVEIRDVNGEPMYHGEDGSETPVRIKVAGSYSARYRRAQEAQTTRALKRRGQVLTGELIQRQRLEVAAACTLDWEGFRNGENPFPASKENALLLYSYGTRSS